MQALEKADAVDATGLSAMDPVAYKAHFKSGTGTTYRCTVTLANFAHSTWAHESLAPNQGLSSCLSFAFIKSLVASAFDEGSIRVMQNRYFKDAGGEVMSSGEWDVPIYVRATSKTEPPQSPYQTCNADAYRAAFLLSWAECSRAAVKKKFVQAARSVYVCFVHLPDEDSYEQRKWSLSEETGTCMQFIRV